MCKDSPPPPADYVGAAEAQGEANLEAAIASSMLSNPNIITPYGSQTVTYAPYTPTGGNTETFNPYAGIDLSGIGFPSTYGTAGYPTVSGGTTSSAYMTPTVTQTFSDTEQAKYDAETAAILGLYDVGLSGLERVGESMAEPFAENPDWQQYQTVNVPTEGANPYATLDASGLPTVGPLTADGLPTVNALNLSGLPSVGPLTTDGLTALGDYSVGGYEAIADAIKELGSFQLEQERSGLTSDLAARGFTPGTEGYDDALRAMGQKENDFDLQAFLAAGAEQSRMNQGLASNRAQEFGEYSSIYDSQNADYNRELQSLLALYGTQAADYDRAFGTSQTIYDSQAEDWTRAFETENALVNSQNNASQMDFSNLLSLLGAQQSSAQDAATIRQNQIQEDAYFRNQPLAELNSLIYGTPAALPQFQQFTGSTITPAPIYQATADLGNYNMQNFANQPDTMGGLFGLGGSVLGGMATGGTGFFG